AGERHDRRRRGPALPRRHGHLHHAGLSLPRLRRADDQLPPAEIDAVHAGQRLRRAGDDAGRLRPRHRQRLSLLFLWRRKPAVSGRRPMSHIDDLPENLAATFDILASAATELQDPWWVFGGAGMALSGLSEWHVPDVDVMTSPRDARRLIEALHGETVEDPGEGLFRSQVFGQILTTP